MVRALDKDLDHVLFVRPEGKVSLPLIGEIQAGGRIVQDLRALSPRPTRRASEEPHIEGPATHDDPAPCIDAREGGGEASAGARMGSVLSREIRYSTVPTPLSEAEGHTFPARQGERWGGPARSETRGTCGTFLRENREIPVLPTVEGAVGRAGKAEGREPVMDGAGKSDRPGVPTKSPNKTGRPAAEAAEATGPGQGERGRAKRAPDTGPGKRAQCARPRTGSSEAGQGTAIHRLASPRRCGAATHRVPRLACLAEARSPPLADSPGPPGRRRGPSRRR
jgi:hypothetical protein